MADVERQFSQGYWLVSEEQKFTIRDSCQDGGKGKRAVLTVRQGMRRSNRRPSDTAYRSDWVKTW
jgi:hypothetical protein